MDLTELKTLTFNSKSRHPWERARMWIIIRMLTSWIRKDGKTNPTIFDIGCGDGYLSSHIAASIPGSEVHAVDSAFTEERIQEIKNLAGGISLSLYDKIENIILLPEKKADFVLLLDVIEHIEEDTGFLSSLAKNKHITKDTLIIITAPAYPCLFSSHDAFLKHYRRYSRKGLIRTISLSGYESLDSGYFFLILLFPRIIKLLFTRMNLAKSADTGIGQWNKGIVISWFLTAALIMDYFICRIFLAAGITLPGLSVYSICKTAV